MFFTYNNRVREAPIQNVVPVRPLPKVITKEVPIVAQPPPPPKKKTMKWGQPTWFLFHTLAEKVKESDFPKIRIELLNLVSTICKTLPCPDCANHATKYMAGINFNAIRTKEDFKNLFFTFHNAVNTRKNFPLFNRSDLESKYSAANTVMIIQDFIKHYEDRHYSIRMIADDFYRTKQSQQIRSWFLANLNSFEM